jgi:hypothetical protein
MVRLLWYFGALALWITVTMLPAKALRRQGKKQPAGVLMAVSLLGVAVLTGLLYAAYVKGWRAPYEGFKRT